MHVPESRRNRRRSSPFRLPADYVPVSQGAQYVTPTRDRYSSKLRSRSRPRERSRGRDRKPIVSDLAPRGAHLNSPVPKDTRKQYDVHPRHHGQRSDHHHRQHHKRPDKSRQRSVSHSSPYGHPAASRITYGRQRSHSFDERDPRMSRTRSGTVYPVQIQPTGYGHSGIRSMHQTQAHPPSLYSPTHYSSNKTSTGMNTMANSFSHTSSAAAKIGQQPIVVLPSDSAGAWTYKPQNAKSVSASNLKKGSEQLKTAHANKTDRGRRSIPGFFSRVFGAKGRSQSAGPRPIHQNTRLQHAVKSVRYAD